MAFPEIGESEEMNKASPTKEKKGKELTFKNPMQIEEQLAFIIYFNSSQQAFLGDGITAHPLNRWEH